MRILSILPVALALVPLAVAAEKSPAPPAQPAGLIQTYQFGFDQDLDANRQPDSWARVIDADHPHYVPAGLDFAVARDGKGSLRIKGDGAPAEFVSPPIIMEGSASYDVSGYIKADALTATGPRRSTAYIEARLYDKSEKLLAAVRCFPEVGGTSDWRQVSAADVSGRTRGAASLKVAAAVDGLSLTGNAWFDSIEVRKRPVASLRTSRCANCFYSSDKKIISFEAKGLSPGQYSTQLRLRDLAGAEKHAVVLDSTVSADGLLSLTYVLPAVEVGPYTIEVELSSGGTALMSQSVRMGVVADRVYAETAKNFGILFCDTPPASSFEYDLTYVSGFGWLKMPLVGIAASEKSQYLRTVSDLRRNGITPVGILALPRPGSALPEVPPSPGGGSDIHASAETESWLPSFTDTINAFAGSVLHWQFGKDEEADALAYAVDPKALSEIARFIDAVSYNAKLGVPVGSPEELQAFPKDAIEFYVFDAGRLAQPLGAAAAGVEYWAWIDPSLWFGGDRDPLCAAAQDISTAFANGATVLFLRDPWKTRGILDGEGNVTPFTLALINLTGQLANYAYAGSIAFPNNTPNAVFSSAEDTTVLLWPAAKPSEERIFLGESVSVNDLYGQKSVAPLQEGENVILVRENPVILAGVDPAIVDTRKTFSIEPETIDSIYEVQPIHVTFTNKFKMPIVGELSLSLPSEWEAQPSIFFVRLKPGESFRGRANLVVPYNALAGQQDIRATLQLGEAGLQKITLVQRRQLTSRAFRMEIDTRPSGTSVLVYQKVSNISDRAADVSAFLEAQGMERVERLPRRIEPGTSTTFSYTIADPSAWKTRKLRASIREARTNRFLNGEFALNLSNQ